MQVVKEGGAKKVLRMKKQRLAGMLAMRQPVASFISAFSAAAFAAEPDAVIGSAGPLINALEALKLIGDV